MPPRPRNLEPVNFDIYYISDIKNYEKRVAQSIDFGYVFDVSICQNHNQYSLSRKYSNYFTE
jgi:hypothetical protein